MSPCSRCGAANYIVNECGCDPNNVPTGVPTVKRADLFGNVVDTHKTEAELNGFRATQGKLV
jgi:hypothetical protein